MNKLDSLEGGLFDEVFIHEDAWAWLQRHPALRSRVSDLVRLVYHFYCNDRRIETDRIRKVDTDHYKIRLTKSLRIPFTFSSAEGGGVRLTFWKVLTHDEGERIHETGVPDTPKDELLDLPADWGPQHLSIEAPKPETSSPVAAPLYRVWHMKDEMRLDADHDADLPWRLSPEQAKFTVCRGPLLLKGSAGSGKTTIAIYRLLSWASQSEDERRLYLTFTRHLRDHAARLYRQLADPDKLRDLPSFVTVEELCRRLVPDANTRFAPDRRFTLDQFLAIPALRQFRLPLPLELLWEEIRGVVKGGFQVVQSDGVALPRRVYEEEIPSNQSLVSTDNRSTVYTAFEKYQKWLTKRDFWDDLDLARAAYRRVEAESGMQRVYDQLIVDEVQDLTTFHVQLLLCLSRHPAGLYLTGDAQQVIHPSRFEWARIKQQLYEHVETYRSSGGYYYGEAPKQVFEVTTNYRSPQVVVELANAVASWRNEKFGERNSTLSAVRDGETVYRLAPAPCATWTDNTMFSHRLMVIVPGEETKPAAQEEFGVGRVFTVHEAKGLEADYVLLWGFFDPDGGAWDYALLRARKPDATGVAEQLRYQVSLFNVAVTRARDALFIIDQTLPDDWPPLTDVALTAGEAAETHIRFVLDQQSRAEDYLFLARELEDRDLLEQAADNYFSGGSAMDGNRCLGLWAERRGAYKEAGGYYEKADMPSKAIACFDRAGEYERAFRLMLVSDLEEGLPRVEEYLADEKRLSKLEGGVVEAIAAAVAAGHPDASVVTLFTYSMHRTGLLRYGIRTSVRDIGNAFKRNSYTDTVTRFNSTLIQLGAESP